MKTLEKELLVALWENNATHGQREFNWGTWAKKMGCVAREVEGALDGLCLENLVEPANSGTYAHISVFGQQFVERHALVEAQVIALHQHFRIQLLHALATIRDEQGLDAFTNLKSTLRLCSAPKSLWAANLNVFRRGGLIEVVDESMVRITDKGYAFILPEMGQAQLIAQLKAIGPPRICTSQWRGQQLEGLLEQVKLPEDWHFERKSTLVPNKNNLILYQRTNPFVVACHWEKKPIGNVEIRNLTDRVTPRPPSRGVLISMSGFSTEALAEVDEMVGRAVILLLGPSDMAMALSGQLDVLIKQKLHQAIVNRKFEFK